MKFKISWPGAFELRDFASSDCVRGLYRTDGGDTDRDAPDAGTVPDPARSHVRIISYVAIPFALFGVCGPFDVIAYVLLDWLPRALQYAIRNCGRCFGIWLVPILIITEYLVVPLREYVRIPRAGFVASIVGLSISWRDLGVFGCFADVAGTRRR